MSSNAPSPIIQSSPYGGTSAPRQGRPQGQLDEDTRAELFARVSPTTANQSPSSIGIMAEQNGMSEEAMLAAARDIEVNRWISQAQSHIEGLQDPQKVIDYWNTLSSTEVELLEAQGMAKPSGRWITRAAQSAFRAATRHNPITRGVQLALRGMESFERVKNNYIRANLAMQEASGQFDPRAAEELSPEQHRQRLQEQGIESAAEMGDEEVVEFSTSINSASSYMPSTLNPSTWKKFWDMTSDGEETFWQNAIQRVEDTGVTGSSLELAKGLASNLAKVGINTSGEDWTDEELDGAMLATLSEMIESEDLTEEEAGVLAGDIRGAFAEPDNDFRKAVETLSHNKLSPGRAAALSQGLTPGTAEFTRHAGIADAANAFIDPILIGGASLKVVRGARYGITGSSSVARKSVTRRYRHLFPEPKKGEHVDPEDIVESVIHTIRSEGAENVLKGSVRRQTRQIADALNHDIARRVERVNARRAAGRVDPNYRPPREAVSGLVQEQPKFASTLTQMADDIGLHSRKLADDAPRPARPGEEVGLQNLIDNGIVRITDDGAAFAVNRQLDEADVVGHFASTNGLKAILSGRMAGHLRHVPIMPHISLTSIPLSKTKNMMTQAIDWANDSPLDIWTKLAKKGKLSDEEYTKLVDESGVHFNLKDALRATRKGAPLKALRGLTATPVGRLMKYATTTAPGKAIDLNSADAILQVQRFAQYLPSNIGRQLVDEFAAADSVGARFQVMSSMFDEVFTRTGLKEVGNGEGAKFVNDFFRELKSEAAQRYALDDLDMVTMASGRQRPAALMLQQTSSAMAMPDIKKLFAYSKRANFWWNVSGGRLFNHGFWDVAVGKVWSPLVLARLGFPMRAGGDEAIQFMMREGFVNWARARAAWSGASKQASKKPLLNPIWRSMDYLQRSARRNMGWYDQTVEKVMAKGDAARLMAMDQMSRSQRWADAATRAQAQAKVVADLPRRGVRAVQRGFAGQKRVGVVELIDKIYDARKLEQVRHLHRQTDHFMTQRVNELYSVSHGTGQFRYDQWMSGKEATRSADAAAGRRLEDIIYQERFTGKWDETTVSEDAELYFDWFRARMEELVVEDDARIAVEVMKELTDDAVREAVDASDDVMAALAHRLDSSDFAAEFNRRWAERLQENPQLRDEVFRKIEHSKTLPDGRVYPGVDSFEEVVGPPGFGRTLLPNAGVDDGMGVWSRQDEAAEFANYAGIGPRVEATLDADELAARLESTQDGAKVVDIDYDGDWVPFDLETGRLSPEEFDSLKGRMQELVNEGVIDELPAKQAVDEFFGGSDQALNDLLTDLVRLEGEVGDVRRLREAIEEARRAENPDELIDIELPRQLDEPADPAGLIDLDRPGGPPRPSSPEAQYNDALARFDRIMAERRRLLSAVPEELGPLAAFLPGVRGVRAIRNYTEYQAMTGSLDPLRALARQGVDPASDVQRRMVGELQEMLDSFGYSGLEQTTEAGARLRTVFDPDRVQVRRTHDAVDLRSTLDQWASSDEALRNVASGLYGLLRQRAFTSSENGSSIPLPGVLRRLLDDGEAPSVDELKALHYGSEDLGQALIDEYPDLLGDLPLGTSDDFADLLASRQQEIDDVLAARFGDELEELGLDDVTQVLMRAESDEALRPLADRITESIVELDESITLSHLDMDGISTKLPERTFGPEQKVQDPIKEITALMWDKPFQVMGQMIDFISREPMFVHNFTRALDDVSEGLWQGQKMARQILDDLQANVDGVTSELSERALAKAGRKTRNPEYGRVTHDDTLTDSIAAVNPETGAIRINRRALQEDYDNGLAYLKGDMADTSLGSAQKAEVFQRQGVDLEELYQWFEANGGVEAYERFIVAHERAHVALGHSRGVKGEWLTDHAILKEMEANQAAFHALDMPFKGTVDTLDFSDSRTAMEHLSRLEQRGARLRDAGYRADLDTVLVEDDIGPKLLEVARRAEGNGFERLPGETDFALTKRVFERTWEAEGDVVGTALERAINTTAPYVDSVPIASTAAVMGRNMVPFWWAEERFLKRLAQTVYHSPESIKKAQLTYEGLKHMGAIQSDDNGQDYFVYPGAGVTHNIMASILSTVTGEDYTVPQVEQITGRVLFALPGLDQLGRPVPGPWVAIPGRAIGERFPHLREPTDAVIGDYAANRQIGNLSMVLPSFLNRAMSAWSPQEAQEQYTSAHLQAMQTLVANGHDIETDPETGVTRPMDPEDFNEKVGRLTHIIAGMRVIYGFAGFAPPSVEFPEGNEVRERLFQLVDVFGFAEGLSQWQQEHPDASPYQVFSTETVGGTSIPATRETLEFMERNEGFLDAHPEAAAYLIPTPETEGPFDIEAWLKQNELGLREQRDTDEFYRAIKFAQAAPVYFAKQDEYHQVREKYKGTQYAAEVDNRWSRWQDRYFAMNPTFRDELVSSDRRERRQRIIDDVGEALGDPDLPVSANVEPLRKLYDGFMQYRHQMDLLSGYTQREPYKSYKNNYKQEFLVWADWMVEAHPEVEPFFNRVMMPELGVDEEELEEELAGAGG